MSTRAIAISLSLASRSSPRSPKESTERTSSGQIIVCMTIMPSRTRSVAIVIRVRIETVATATRSSPSRASRSRTYGFCAALSGSR